MRATLAAALAAILALLMEDALARAGGHQTAASFECRPAHDGTFTLTCDTSGLSEARSAPEWYVAEPDGRLVDRARGWNAVDLWPSPGISAEIIMQARPPGRVVQLRCTAPAGRGCEAREP